MSSEAVITSLCCKADDGPSVAGVRPACMEVSTAWVLMLVKQLSSLLRGATGIDIVDSFDEVDTSDTNVSVSHGSNSRERGTELCIIGIIKGSL
jgi:hypothetical protein